LRPKIDDHDFEAKARTVRKLLADGDKVKVNVMFRGREITHPEIGWRLLQRMSETLKEVASVERQPVMEGRNMYLILSAPQKVKAKEEVKS
jgi:translation initiation factor IF-3